MLTEWKNLNTIQDTRKVASIEEFKNKKFRYQMSEYSVEKFSGMDGQDAGTVYTWWNDLNNDFIRLNQNYQDYIRDTAREKAQARRKAVEQMKKDWERIGEKWKNRL